MEEHVYQSPGKSVISQIFKTLHQYFPSLKTHFASLPDSRRRKQYSTQELAMAGVCMFMLKEGSRNAFNNDRKDPVFRANYQSVFGLDLPHLDTVDDYFRDLATSCLEEVKASLIRDLLRKKVLQPHKYRGCYIVAIDGTGVSTYSHKHCEYCLHKKSGSGVVTWSHNVLEAKLLTPTGLSLSIATEWISNEGRANYQKQDCEQAAFKRLSIKIKKMFPRLPIIIIADGLYPTQGFFDICKRNNWHYVVTLKDGNLRLLQEEIALERRLVPNQKGESIAFHKDHRTKLLCHWLSGLEYKTHMLNWVECNEEVSVKNQGVIKGQRFVHITDMELSNTLCVGVSQTGRLRQKIENEGFNDQKNQGYALEHKFSRVSFPAMKNYYQCLQIAHIINQLVQASQEIRGLIKARLKCTVKYLWKRLMSYMLEVLVDRTELLILTQNRFQIRLE